MSNWPVLIVDDEPQVRSLIRTVLSKHDFRIVEARDGVSALSTVLDLDGAIGLMVTDYFMPGIDGLHLSKQVKLLFPGVPILLVSGEAFIDGDNFPADAFLAKPFLPSTLVDTVRRLYKKESPREQDQCA